VGNLRDLAEGAREGGEADCSEILKITPQSPRVKGTMISPFTGAQEAADST